MTEIKITIGEGRERSYRRNQSSIDKPYAPSRVFLDFGENVWEHLQNRRSRDWRTLKPLVAEELNAAGIPVERLRWSRYAGCTMCPCSGGFIIEGQYGKDYWAQITVEEMATA